MLTKKIANAICATITVGYIKKDGKNTKFQYAGDNEKDDYKDVQKKLKAIGLDLEISSSLPQADMAYIFAKNSQVYRSREVNSRLLEIPRVNNSISK